MEDYTLLNINVGDKYKLKKAHPCGSFDFEVVRSGADCKLKCLKCEHVIMLDRVLLKKSIKSIIEKCE